MPLSVKEALNNVFIPQVEELIAQLNEYAEEWKDVPMLAKTHGQPASPTRLGKEIMVFVYRLNEQLQLLKACKHTAKFGGATGNYNAHHVAYPEYDWRAFGNKFVSEKLGLEREQFTTQISNYDHLSSIFDAIRRINTIIIDLDRDAQVAHANIAIVKSNGIGRGPGNSEERDFLSQAFSDFIYAIIIEEMGIEGAALIAILAWDIQHTECRAQSD